MIVAPILRADTHSEHVRTEAVYGAFDLGTRDGYAQFLIAQASAFIAVERALDAAGAAERVADWSGRRRSALLLADLAELDAGEVRLQPSLDFDSEAKLLGGIYVLEGSRLGGKVVRSQLPEGLPVRFLGADGEHGAWRSFLQSLDVRLSDQHALRSAVESARGVFRSFEQSARETLELNVGR